MATARKEEHIHPLPAIYQMYEVASSNREEELKDSQDMRRRMPRSSKQQLLVVAPSLSLDS